jgi:hypothetical protein
MRLHTPSPTAWRSRATKEVRLRKVQVLLCLVVALAFASSARAELISYRFEFEVDGLNTEDGNPVVHPDLIAFFPLGSTAWFDLTWNTVATLDPLGSGGWRAPTQALTLFNERYVSTPRPTLFNFWVNDADGGGFVTEADLLPQRSSLAAPIFGPQWYDLRLDYAPGTLDPTVIPSELPSTFLTGRIHFVLAVHDEIGEDHRLHSLSGRVVSTTPVPEPASAALLAFGIGAAFVSCRRLKGVPLDEPSKHD